MSLYMTSYAEADDDSCIHQSLITFLSVLWRVEQCQIEINGSPSDSLFSSVPQRDITTALYSMCLLLSCDPTGSFLPPATPNAAVMNDSL